MAVEIKKASELTLAEVKALPNWEEDKTICNIIAADKRYGEEKESFFIKIYMNATGITERLMKAKMPKFLPDTSMHYSDLLNTQVTLTSIFDDLKILFKKYVYFGEEKHYDLCVLGAIASYFRESFNHFPYFDFVSPEYNCGKTTALTALMYASYNGFMCGDASEAAIFRIIEDSHASLGYDDIDYVFFKAKSESSENILRLFTSGHTKGIPAVRVEEINKKRVPVPYDAFSLKGFTRTKRLPPALETRCVSIHMLRAPKTWVNPKEELTEEIFRSARGKMYMFRLLHSTQIAERYQYLRQLDIGIYHRARDNALPILTVASLINKQVYDSILAYLLEEYDEASNGDDDRSHMLYDLIVSHNWLGLIKTSEIRNLFNACLIEHGEITDKQLLHPNTITHMLTDMGFKRGRIGQDRAINITKERLEELKLFFEKANEITLF